MHAILRGAIQLRTLLEHDTIGEQQKQAVARLESHHALCERRLGEALSPGFKIIHSRMSNPIEGELVAKVSH